MKFDIITIFPEIFDSYLEASLIDRAQRKELIEVKIHDLRDWANDPHHTVDDRPYGGGIGMVMKVGPIYRAVKEIKEMRNVKEEEREVVLFTPRGKTFDQTTAHSFSKVGHLIMICGRYEGVDERVAQHIADIELSIGDYVLMGGELPAMVVLESTARLIPGVLGKPQLLDERVTEEKGFIEYPQYTRPEVFEPQKSVEWKVPSVLLSGHHQKIRDWRQERSEIIKDKD